MLPKLMAFAGIMTALLLKGCAVGESSSVEAPGNGVTTARAVGVVDSSLSMEEGLRRFREGLPVVSELTAGDRSREALVRRFVRALERSDTNDLRAMAITRSEFAYLYYPASQHTRPPTAQVAGLVWFFNIQSSQKGLTRAMRRYGGKPLLYGGHTCAAAPIREGPNTFWSACNLRIAAAPNIGDVSLFGTIIEREGRFKFLTYANDF